MATIQISGFHALPEDVTPQPGFQLVRDGSFWQFCDQIRMMNVQATFEGRFEAFYTWKQQERVWITSAQGKKGFGNKGRHGGRIVLYRVQMLWLITSPALDMPPSYSPQRRSGQMRHASIDSGELRRVGRRWRGGRATGRRGVR